MSANKTQLGQSLCHCTYMFHLWIFSRKMQNTLTCTISFLPILATHLQLAITETLSVGRFTNDSPWMSTPDVSNWLCLQHNDQPFPQPFTINNAWCSMLNCFFRLNLYLTENKSVLVIKTIITARDHTTHTGFHVQCLLFLFILIKIKCFDKC